MLILTDENFEREIQNSSKPILVDFWGFYCGPCFILLPILEKLAEEFKDKIIFAKANLDNLPLIARKYEIEQIPTVILFKEGKPVSGFIGVRPEEKIREWLNNNLIVQENKKFPDKLENESKKIEELIREYEQYAEQNGFSLNPNRKIVETIVRGLLENEKKYGKRYCPCRRITGNPEEDEKIVCPCIYTSKEIEEKGHCFCGLFVK